MDKVLTMNAEFIRPDSTVFITGVGRSGTSAFAYILRQLHYGTTEDIHPLKHESSPICYDEHGFVDQKKTVRAIDKYDKTFSRWMWKAPRDLYTRHQWLHLVRNPVILVCERNPASVFASASNKEHLPWEAYIRPFADFHHELAALFECAPCPTLMLSYENLLKDPEKTIRYIASLFGVPVNEAAISEIASAVSQREYVGINGNSTTSPKRFGADELELDRKFAGLETLVPHIQKMVLATKDLMQDSIAAMLLIEAEQEMFDAGYLNEINVRLVFVAQHSCAPLANELLQPLLRIAVETNPLAIRKLFPCWEHLPETCLQGNDGAHGDILNLYHDLRKLLSQLVKFRMHLQRILGSKGL
jgi:hypothetical protein